MEGLRRAGAPGDISDTAVVDPLMSEHLAGQQERWDKEGEGDPTKRSKIADPVIDADSTSYIIDLPGGNRLMVVPDLRTDDLRRTAKDPTGPARTNFERALAQVTHSEAKFTAWNMTHHMQSGWVADKGGTHVSSATELIKFTEFMQNIREVQASKRPAGQAAPADVVVVSAQHTLAKSMVNPAMVWLLRSLGFEVFLAHSDHDVRLIEATTAGGEKVEGVAGLPYEGLRPTDPLLMQSEAALRHLDQKWQLEDARKAPKNMKAADKTALKESREANQKRIDAARESLRTAREAYIEAVRDELERGPNDTTKKASAPDPAQGVPPKVAAAETTLRDAMKAQDLSDFTAPIATEAPIISDTALVLMRMHGDRPLDALDRQIAEANERLDALRRKLQAGEDAVRTKAQLLAELNGFRKLIQEKLPDAPEASKPLLSEELVNTQRELESIVHTQEGQVLYSREPGTGRLITSRVIAASPQAKTADSVRSGLGRRGKGWARSWCCKPSAPKRTCCRVCKRAMRQRHRALSAL